MKNVENVDLHLVIKWSRNGRFYACSTFPECKFTKPLFENEEIVATDKTCPKCDSTMNLKEGRYGKFWACSKYPDCKSTLPYDIGIKCPEEGCDGDIIEKRTKRGKPFYGCSKYPECKWASWNTPIKIKCPTCDFPFLEKKETQRMGTQILCSNCKSKFSEEDLEQLKEK